VFTLKRASLPLLLLLVSFLLLSLTSTHFHAGASPSANFVVDQVNHVVQTRNGGLVVINDTIMLSVTDGQLTDFSVGLPYGYQSHLDSAFAYEGADTSRRLEITLNYGLGTVGFYGVNVRFSQALGSGSHSFTVVFVFSGLVSATIFVAEEEQAVVFYAVFPLYPSLRKSVSMCNVSVLFPVGFNYTSSGLDFTRSTSGSNQVLRHLKNNLPEFALDTSWVRFSKVDTDFLVVELNEVKRRVEIEGTERISVFNEYHLTNNGAALSKITLKLPQGAHDPSAWDTLGILSLDSEGTVTFRSPIEKGASTTLTLIYSLPWENCVKRLSPSIFQFSFMPMDNFDWTIRRLTIAVTLPEGAEFQSSTNTPTSLSGVQRRVFQQIITFDFENVTSFQSLSVEATYSYLIFWSSFRPTMWMGVLVIVVVAVALLWRLPKPAVPIPTIMIHPEELKSFVEAYEEKRRNMQELESLEAQARRGKIPRRHYKVRRRTLESRLSVLSRDLAVLREKLWRAGGAYADMVRQVEVAETELQGVEADINRTEARYRRGEISSAAYRKLLEDSYRRRDRAKTTIDGVLLRLREEIR